VQLLRASTLPYESAFAQQPVPPVPEALRARVEELSSVALASRGLALEAAGPGGRWQLNGRRANPWLLGLLLALAIGVLAGYWGGARTRTPDVEPWVRMVSSYHSMYGRETVVDGGASSAQTVALKARLGQQLGLNLKIPDLEAEGLHFVRAQQLQFDGRMVLQMVYLPEQGLPIALCVTPAAAQPERVLTLDGQQAVTWHASGWAYVLIGQMPAPQLERLRGQLKAPVV
jgi:anti-sigma factor RsiW